MRIAQVSPLFECVPPRYYGGTERVVSHLTEELVRRGHDVTLFACGDSVTRARLVATSPAPLRSVPPAFARAAEVEQLEDVLQRAHEFDVIHFHTDHLHLPATRRLATPHLTTMHGRLDSPQVRSLYRTFAESPLVSISEAQREPLPWADWQATVHHGLPQDLLRLHPEPGSYLAFVGRMSPEKRVDRAIAIARRAGVPLRIAAKVDNQDRDYFQREIAPLLADPLVEYVGEIGDAEKDEFIGNACGLLFPIDWPEPFGLVMIEALACGTPVIAFPRGSVSEVITDGVTGFLVDSVEAGVEAVSRLSLLSRRRCREVFEERFSARRMADDYLAVYERLVTQPADVTPLRAASRPVPLRTESREPVPLQVETVEGA